MPKKLHDAVNEHPAGQITGSYKRSLKIILTTRSHNPYVTSKLGKHSHILTPHASHLPIAVAINLLKDLLGLVLAAAAYLSQPKGRWIIYV